MLCRRMRLTERHIQPPREPNEGPIIRPCTARKLDGIDRDSTLYPVGHHGRKSAETNKIPLMIVNLNIPPGTKTLAPKNLKSPRKLPPFCVQHQHLAKAFGFHQSNAVADESSANQSTIPRIFIQGFEIQDKKMTPLKSRQTLECNIRPITENDEDSFTNILLDNISNISLDMINRHQKKLFGTSKYPQIADKTCKPLERSPFLNLDSYEIDEYEQYPDKSDEVREDSPPLSIPLGYRSLCYRTSSPNTRQVIRVNVTMSKERSLSENLPVNR
ncbi:uncharacterized protein LOC131428484 [Malaya genurostris]|uniref:uncharacterized protein LOC131428484 n=1 Tax=Malaya genurostris TaxID=325434 RepID=UPI0026F3D68B|nr:uncharacterized protein LOC131428484 [Malaya genurostris]XP_058448448.1 uncharacterized protein LOC131428484 [Malaya genurostris]XP_058448449.1 uncharacterized protein LOC131428484 [Malaya genurostris]XP_058448450.1 uncharacterized protein LOC131428484 [Malaya genurostris]XP_058448451.1 uncharacterized protein LOC131428484 [Malaya genurostris]